MTLVESRGTATPEANHDAPSSAGDQGSQPGDAVGDDAADSEDIERLWTAFLESVYESPRGGYALGDMSFAGQAELLDYFSALYAARIDKGLTWPSLKWPGQIPTLTICWAPYWSDASTAEMEHVEALVQNTWARTVNINFDFRDGNGNLRLCAESQCGFVTCPTGTEDIKIGHHSDIDRGCSVIGTASPPASCPGLPPTPDYYPSMALPTGSSGYIDHTIVHEFGHAIGLLHEHTRNEYPWRAGSGNPLWCQDADDNITSDPNNTPTNLNDDVRATPPVGSATVGNYDPESIMNYCALDGPGLLAYQQQLSLGDLFAVRSLYQSQLYSVHIQHSSWYDTPVQITLDLSPSVAGVDGIFDLTATRAAATFASASSGNPGNDYVVTANSTGGSRMKCFTARPPAQGVIGEPLVIPPIGFASTPVKARCYDPAGLSASML